MMSCRIVTFLLLVPVVSGTAFAADRESTRPELFDKLVECRSIADNAQRLACYDRQVGAIDAAEKKQDLVIMDRKQVRETRRSLFGFTLPKFSLGGRKLDDGDEVNDIDTSILAASRRGYSWILTMANDNGVWETSDQLTRDQPKTGVKVHIKRAAMGSYLGSIGNNRGIRLRRVN